MKIRTISIFLIFALAVLLPIAAQQSPAPSAPAAPKAAAKPACVCCSHEMPAAPDQDRTAMSCCTKQPSAEMACCTSKPDKTRSEDGKIAMECGKDTKAKMCDGKDGKSCCSGTKCAKSCCGKGAMAS